MTLVILIIKEGLHAFLLHDGQKGFRCIGVGFEEVVPDRRGSGLIDDFEGPSRIVFYAVAVDTLLDSAPSPLMGCTQRPAK